MEPDVARESLARKYETLLRLRCAYNTSGEIAPRETLRALSREFPGALRELDTLALTEISRRVETLRGECVPEPWVPWMIAYHALLRELLALKLSAALGENLTPERLPRALAEITSRTGLRLSAEALTEVLKPGRGRLNPRVFAMLGAHFGEAPAVIFRGLFPSAKREPGAQGGGPL